MRPDERERMNRLCKRIQEEKDPLVFDQLVEELDALLQIKHERIHPEHSALWGTKIKPLKRTPKKGDRVSAHGQTGTFVVSTVDSSIQSATLQKVGHDLALDAIPWDSLTYLDDLDDSLGT